MHTCYEAIVDIWCTAAAEKLNRLHEPVWPASMDSYMIFI